MCAKVAQNHEKKNKRRKNLKSFIISLKSAPKSFNVLLARMRSLITELSDKLRLKHPLLPTFIPLPHNATRGNTQYHTHKLKALSKISLENICVSIITGHNPQSALKRLIMSPFCSNLSKNDWSTFPLLFHISETKEHRSCSLLFD